MAKDNSAQAARTKDHFHQGSTVQTNLLFGSGDHFYRGLRRNAAKTRTESASFTEKRAKLLSASLSKRDEFARGQETAESLELRLLNAETTLKLMADRVSKADDKTKREIALALVDRITIETIREDDEVRTTARVRYSFDPPPIERYTQRHHLRYPEMLSPVSPVVNYLTCAWPHLL